MIINKKHLSLFCILLFLIDCNNKDIQLYNVNFCEGKIESAKLCCDTKIKIKNNIVAFKKNTYMTFNYYNGCIESGYICADQNIIINNNKFIIKAVGKHGINLGQYDISFHSNGVPHIIWLAEDKKIKIANKEYNISAAKTLFHIELVSTKQYKEYVEFFDDGSIYSIYLADDIKLKNKVINAGTQLLFNKDGEINKYWDKNDGNYKELK